MNSYRTLCYVDILHDYFLSRGDIILEAQAESEHAALTSAYNVKDFLAIEPDDATVAVLAGQRMLFRPTASGFLLAVQIDATASDTRPAIVPPPDLRLTFVLRVRDARFANYTELGAVTTGFYRFGNDSGSVVAGTCSLSRPVPAFDAARRYVAGEVYAESAAATFNLLVALRDTGPAATPTSADWQRVPRDTWSAARTYQSGAIVLLANRIYRARIDSPGTDLNNAAEWQLVTTLGNQYASRSDAIALVGNGLDVDLAATTLSRATARVTRHVSSAVVLEETFESSGPLERIHLDLSRLAAGTYRMEILDDARAPVASLTSSIYLSPGARAENWFGVVELRAGAGELALFNADGSLRTPRYTLRFLNRATRWRYIFPAPQPVGSGAEVAPEPGDARVLVTSVPCALTRFGVGMRLQADDASTAAVTEEVLLPAPEVKRIRRQNAQWFSEIRLPNLTLGH